MKTKGSKRKAKGKAAVHAARQSSVQVKWKAKEAKGYINGRAEGTWKAKGQGKEKQT